VIAAVLLAAGASACESRQLYIASNTVAGLHAELNTAQTNGKLVFGYERDFVAIIPKSVENSGENAPAPGTLADTVNWRSGEGRELMSVLGCTDLKVDGIVISRFNEYLATGQAAKNFAVAIRLENAAKITRAFFECLRAPEPAENS